MFSYLWFVFEKHPLQTFSLAQEFLENMWKDLWKTNHIQERSKVVSGATGSATALELTSLVSEN